MGRSSKERRSKGPLDYTLEERDGERWGEPGFSSYVVTTCHAARRKPLRTLTPEELRLVIGQGIGLPWLVPLALSLLLEEPLRCVSLYSGDLLASVARVPAPYWAEHPAEKAQLLNDILPRALGDADMAELPKEAATAVRGLIEMAVK